MFGVELIDIFILMQQGTLKIVLFTFNNGSSQYVKYAKQFAYSYS